MFLLENSRHYMDEILPIRRKLYTINLLENVYRVWHKITFITIKVSNVCHWNSTYLQEPADEHMDGSIKSYLSEKKSTVINSQSKFYMYWRSSQFYLSCNFYIVGIPLQKMTIQYNNELFWQDSVQTSVKAHWSLVNCLFVFNEVNLFFLYNR